MPIKSEFKRGFKWVLRACTLSTHFVSTLCRLRFVPALCPYAVSNAKAGAAEAHKARPIVLEPGTAVPAGTAGTAGGWRRVSTGGDRSDDHRRIVP